ncbi:hypothetical protein FB45DRAFT_925145 [Roridomyces roridus]|uniref:Translation machinery-associated protein 16 n=1 Tax=Roridomyces roridus TaxID=1738132 RepID=A0AAD7BK52_9AGAR|nr:hypothetical protein FB45DRAFT_925145 [Roridomyces roridus]
MPPKPKAAARAKAAAAAKGGNKPGKKEKVFHPDSRKAGQLARNALRKGKLGNLRTKRTKKASTLLEMYKFFHAALPPPIMEDSENEALTLPQLHMISQAWVARNDEVLAEERATRRPGRPKSAREMRIEEVRLREQETYRTGMEVPDLTDAPTLARFRKWDVGSIGYAHLLRFVRISSAQPDVIVFARAPTAGTDGIQNAEDDSDDEDEQAPDLLDAEMDET